MHRQRCGVRWAFEDCQYNWFVIDVGGSHVIFSRDATLLNKLLNLLENNVIALRRRAYVLLNGFFVPYPLENGLYVLPIEERLEAITTFIETLLSLEKGWKPKNFEEWIIDFLEIGLLKDI